MAHTLRIALRATCVTLVLCGVVYPLLVVALAQGLFPRQANGSLLHNAQGQVLGSQLLAQAAPSPAYFMPRPSAAGAHGYDAMASGGSNLGPHAQALQNRLQETLHHLPQGADIPADMLLASGSGLDPHISPQAARWQALYVAQARRIKPERIAALINDMLEGPDWHVFGDARVNVLLLNLALDERFGQPDSEHAGAP